ncbi:MAG: hypothetical protein QMD77_00080 [Patescibacteria group bacterium]|nr:hypothetical protein [Patescibacteria group bacterium]
MTEFEKQVAEALKKISDRIKSFEKSVEQQRFYLDEILKVIEPKWKALSQDEEKE